MSYDAAKDTLVEALRAIVKREVTRELEPVTGETAAVLDTRGFPAPLDLLEQMRLPCMCVYVTGEAATRTTVRKLDSRCDVTFEYILPATPLGKLDARWPLLRAVWAATLKVVTLGVLSGNQVLEGVGVIRVDDEHASARYSFASEGENAYPVFVGTIPITVRPSEALPTQDLLELVADINRVEDDANPAIQPQVQVIATPAP